MKQVLNTVLFIIRIYVVINSFCWLKFWIHVLQGTVVVFLSGWFMFLSYGSFSLIGSNVLYVMLPEVLEFPSI